MYSVFAHSFRPVPVVLYTQYAAARGQRLAGVPVVAVHIREATTGRVSSADGKRPPVALHCCVHQGCQMRASWLVVERSLPCSQEQDVRSARRERRLRHAPESERAGVGVVHPQGRPCLRVSGAVGDA